MLGLLDYLRGGVTIYYLVLSAWSCSLCESSSSFVFSFRAKTGAGMPSSSAVSAQLRSSPPNFESTPQAQPPAYSSSPPPVFATNSGPLPYNAEQVGIGAAIEMALRKKDTRAVRILQWAREEMQSQMAASPHY
mmetsp:Transcript_32862/g.53374  ORF Transcript_32862/g.53374 Transcript_32862/m.53374 type:complete len:134 (+) Transcript_32862:426-827(+)